MSQMLNIATSIVFDGVAYAMILFVISAGLSVTMGLLGFVNLAHGVFAMAGGYVVVALMSKLGVGFVPALALAALAVGVVSVLIEFQAFECGRGGLDQANFRGDITLAA